MPIYTKKGDKGETGLPGGRRLSKTEALFEVLGALDQTNAALGLAVSLVDNQRLARLIQAVQSDLLALGAHLASDVTNKKTFEAKLIAQKMEKQIDQWDEQLPELKNFILPGGHPAAAAVHQARTLIRQAERAYHRTKTVDEAVSIYLNRLSDYLFQMARFINFVSKTTEIPWIVN